MRRNKTRRHLKGRRATRRRRQRGGAVTSAKAWVDAVMRKISLLPDQKLYRFGDLADTEELTLTPPTSDDSNPSMDVSIIEDGIQRYEDIRNMGAGVKEILKSILKNAELSSVTPQEFADTVNDQKRLDDDTIQDSFIFLLRRENALRTLADIDTLATDAPVTTLAEASVKAPLFIVALAINSTGEPLVSLFNPEQLSNALSPPSL
jgi:hypothetical protein